MGLHVKRVSQHRFYHFSGAWFNVKAWRTGRQYARQESAGAEGGTKCPPAPPLRYIHWITGQPSSGAPVSSSPAAQQPQCGHPNQNACRWLGNLRDGKLDAADGAISALGIILQIDSITGSHKKLDGVGVACVRMVGVAEPAKRMSCIAKCAAGIPRIGNNISYATIMGSA